ncbi:NAD(P)-binding protein [uncultured Lutibacter sp.]|uniref:protoporphyrinogen/coproporphyrinogen oxidase n=1 Tax=uncultured Lutibacter sp. TaxID=437739 RepID=UPI00262C5BA2|nr:NAD(P)-binding protein [uncultured Lutibacter sp.]
MKIGVVGAGISGLSISNILSKENEVVLYESSNKVGGLIQCDTINGNLFHKVGGHVFNSKNKDVLDWFWDFFNKEKDFISSKRNAKILMNSKLINYPIENFIYQLDEKYLKKIIPELITCSNNKRSPFEYNNFFDYLENSFGRTLCELYFIPYNQKIWNVNLKEIPMNWLEGKLPMPNISQIILANILRLDERNMVHSEFFYPKKNGSQFIADKLASKLNVNLNFKIHTIKKVNNKLLINGLYSFDKIIYTGNIKNLLSDYLKENIPNHIKKYAKDLKFNGTTTVLCSVDSNDISWMYLPESKVKSHRIIYTGNFSKNNNSPSLKNQNTCTIEFSGFISKDEIANELKRLPGNTKMIAYNYQPFSYVIQDTHTREQILEIKNYLSNFNIYLLGRFAEWEYYNMDKAIEAAMNLAKQLKIKNV